MPNLQRYIVVNKGLKKVARCPSGEICGYIQKANAEQKADELCRKDMSLWQTGRITMSPDQTFKGKKVRTMDDQLEEKVIPLQEVVEKPEQKKNQFLSGRYFVGSVLGVILILIMLGMIFGDHPAMEGIVFIILWSALWIGFSYFLSRKNKSKLVSIGGGFVASLILLSFFGTIVEKKKEINNYELHKMPDSGHTKNTLMQDLWGSAQNQN